MLDAWLAHHLQPGPVRRWRRWQIGNGYLALYAEALRLGVPATAGRRYSNAQIDDYAGLARAQYPWRPPLRLTVRARFSATLAGTAGFGFWNHPFAPNTGIGALPVALWFLRLSPPNDLPIALDVPGSGFKAAMINTGTWRARRWLPVAPLVVVLNRWPLLRRRLWSRVQRDLGIGEALLSVPPDTWQHYTIEWYSDGARWLVGERPVLQTEHAPRGPLGFVAWVDNQYAVARPTGRLGWGLCPVPTPQWLDLATVRIEPL